MSQKAGRLKKTTAAVTALTTLFMGVPLQAGTPCVPPAGGPAANTGNLGQAVQFLKDKTNCNGILSTPEELSFLKQVDQINEDYLSGKISLKERGEACINAATKAAATGDAVGVQDKDQRLRALLATALKHSSDLTDAFKKTINLQVSTGKKLTDDQKQALLRVGINPDNLKGIDKSTTNSIGALKAAGVTTNAKGSLDFTGMSGKYTVAAINSNIELSKGIINYLGSDQAAAFLNPNRKTAFPLQNDVVLPPGKNGKIQIVSADAYNQETKNTLQNFVDASKAFLSNSKASTTLGKEIGKTLNGSTQESTDRMVAQAHMDSEFQHLQALGFPGIQQISQFRDDAKKIDASNTQAGTERLHKLEGAVAFTAAMAIGGASLSWMAEAADAGETAGAVNLYKGSSNSRKIMEAVRGSEQGAVDMQRAIREASEAITLKNMAPMAAMPFVFSAASSAIGATIDKKAGDQGSWMCRFTTDLSNKTAENVMMANFAWAAPVTALVGGLAEASAGGRVAAESAMANAERAQKYYFDGVQGVSVVQGLYNCATHTGTEAQKQCADAAMGIGFLGMGNVALKDSIGNAKDMIVAKQKARSGDLEIGSTFTDNYKNEYHVVDKGADAKGNYVVAQDDTGAQYQVYADKLKNGKTSVMTAAEKAKAAQAQQAYARIPAAEDLVASKETATQTTPTQGTNEAADPGVKTNPADKDADVADVPKEQTVGELMKTDPKLATIEQRAVSAVTKMAGDAGWDKKYDLPTDKKIMIKTALDSLSKDDMILLDKKLETKREDIVKAVEDAGEGCLGKKGTATSQADDGSWDQEGNFVGILYAQNSSYLNCRD